MGVCRGEWQPWSLTAVTESSPAATQAGPHLFSAVTQQSGKRPKCLVFGTRLSLAALGGPAADPAAWPPPPAAGPGAAASFLRDRRAGGHRVLGRLLSLGAGGSRPVLPRVCSRPQQSAGDPARSRRVPDSSVQKWGNRGPREEKTCPESPSSGNLSSSITWRFSLL